MYDIQFNGIFAKDLKLLVKDRPDIPAPKKRSEKIEISGKDGTLIERDGTYEDIIINVPFNYMATQTTWAEIYRKAKAWLLSEGNFELILSDDPDYFYKVKDVEIEPNERLSMRVGSFSANFLCNPYQYVISGKREYIPTEVIYNHFLKSHPTYAIRGEGICALNVNGNVFTVNVSEHVNIDTDRMLAYKDSEIRNTMVTGKYEDLYLLPGKNEITYTEGFDVKVIPNWRCL